MSFYTSLSGLKGAQTDLSVISNNIANVGSYGFKKSRAQFGDLMPPSSTTAGQGTRLAGITQQFSQGGFESSARELDLAISGQGFFVTRDSLTGGTTYFSRNGSLNVDANNYLVDSNGGYIQALPTDAQGNVTASGLAASQNIQLPATNGTPIATGLMNISLSLPSNADIPADRPAFNGGSYAFDRLDPNSYNHSIQTSVFDPAGNSIPATLYFVRTGSTANGDPADTWEARMFVGNEEVSSQAGVTPPAPLALEFDAAGELVAPTGATAFDSVYPAGASGPLSLSLDFGATTRQAQGAFRMDSLQQDGRSAGKLTDVSIDAKGLVVATFSDGTTQALGKLLIADFANPAGLRQQGDGRWTVTGKSGEPQVGGAGEDGFGRIQSGALERANVDITDELVALISAQRNFQANAKAIETGNAMTQSILNLRN